MKKVELFIDTGPTFSLDSQFQESLVIEVTEAEEAFLFRLAEKVSDEMNFAMWTKPVKDVAGPSVE